MNFQQLKYIIAVDENRHFGKAAKCCHVTQPTLSMMIKKLEDELDATIFDRSRKPVIPTEVGTKVIAKARRVIREMQELPELIEQHNGDISGKLRIAVIPTLAPYLLPLFVRSMMDSYPDIELQVKDMLTEDITEALKRGDIDVGILVTPLKNKNLAETPLFYEKFFCYVANSHPLFDKKYILPEDISAHQLWLLEEGHCFRSQIVNLCKLKESQYYNLNFKYEAGSIQTMKKFVEQNSGITILPELATQDMSGPEKKLLRSFLKPVPVREVSLVTHRNFIKKQLIVALKEEIVAAIPDAMHTSDEKQVIAVE